MISEEFHPLEHNAEIPQVFPSPFDVQPHALADLAALSLRRRLPSLCESIHQFDVPDGGKMFGVLVVRTHTGQIGYLSAFSGMLGGRWKHGGFVPPVFDLATRESVLVDGERWVAELSGKIEALQTDTSFIENTSQLKYQDELAASQLQLAKEKNLNRKQERDLQRQKPGITPVQLDALAGQSRKDKIEFKKLKIQLREQSAKLRLQWSEAQNEIDLLKRQRKACSHKLQAEIFEGYRLLSVDVQTRTMADFFEADNPPSGAGDCAAIKLVQYANQHQLQPIALAEFWWGAAPLGGLRQHSRYYPSCRSRCRVLLPFMLSGLEISIPLHEQAASISAEYPYTLFEDNDIVVVDKPAGLLSVPGKVLTDSVEARLKARYPDVEGVMLIHRLDQATSGVMIAARNPAAHKLLQHQFQDRTIEKKYLALLDGKLETTEGEVKLPLRVDIYDRPRQIVCAERGKAALTRYSVISVDEHTTRVAFYPHTGRTHQLRVHAAHPEGLNCPILGDELYGRPVGRLHLHAEQLTFNHPVTGCRMTIASEVPF